VEKVTKYTRASKNGTAIFCPKCKSVFVVYHFSWSGLMCNHCNKMYSKNQFLIDKNLPLLSKLIRRDMNHVLKVKTVKSIIKREPKQELINRTKELINEFVDYYLVERVIDCQRDVRKKSRSVSDTYSFAIVSIAVGTYKKIESNDIHELRKQKLLKINKVA
jgi:phage FluMu protein Com